MNRHKEGLLKRLRGAALVLLLLPLILPLALVTICLSVLYRGALYLLVWLVWLPKGKDILFVYSDSPIWREYMTMELLPLVERRAVILNWSERSKWPQWSLGVEVFRRFGGTRDFSPLVVLFRPLQRARTFRFWPAFKDWKRGYREPVERLRQELLSAL
ncbi:MAG TPA: hypothetical protein VF845_07250 [Terriglobales bacterium]